MQKCMRKPYHDWRGLPSYNTLLLGSRSHAERRVCWPAGGSQGLPGPWQAVRQGAERSVAGSESVVETLTGGRQSVSRLEFSGERRMAG